jgi:hypothetical protein
MSYRRKREKYSYFKKENMPSPCQLHNRRELEDTTGPHTAGSVPVG